MTSAQRLLLELQDPLKLCAFLWPQYRLYDKQREIIMSVEDNYNTVVPSANQMGKDFVAAMLSVTWFLRHWPVRIVTTSVKDDHLRVLWGEIGRLVQTAAIPLESRFGGPLIIHHREIRKVHQGQRCEISYLIGQVSEKGEGMAGHHSPYSLLIGDESSGLDNEVHVQGRTWAKRMFFFGNPNPTENFFREAVDGGDLLNERVVAA